MSVASDVVVSDDKSLITYKDMYGNEQTFRRTHACDFDVRDVLQMYAAAFKRAMNSHDAGEARKIFNENTQYYFKQSFEQIDALQKAGVAPEVLEKVVDNMALLITRQRPHTVEAEDTSVAAILEDISQELKQPPRWEMNHQNEEIDCR